VSGWIHHLFVRAEQCLVRVLLNGFPIVELTPGNMVFSTAPMVNQLLVGKGNELLVTLWTLPPAEEGRVPPADIEGSVRRFGPKDLWAQPSAGECLATIGLDEALIDSGKRGNVELPFSLVARRFDNDGPCFRERLLEGEPIRDRNAVIDYGLRLRDWLRAQDTTNIAEQIDPKLVDYAEAYYGSVDQLRYELLGFLRGKLFARGLMLEFGADDLEATPCCNERIWRLRRPGNEPFIRTHEDADGFDSMMEVYVGVVDGQLRIVR
jgi:hypothetical protein